MIQRTAILCFRKHCIIVLFQILTLQCNNSTHVSGHAPSFQPGTRDRSRFMAHMNNEHARRGRLQLLSVSMITVLRSCSRLVYTPNRNITKNCYTLLRRDVTDPPCGREAPLGWLRSADKTNVPQQLDPRAL